MNKSDLNSCWTVQLYGLQSCVLGKESLTAPLLPSLNYRSYCVLIQHNYLNKIPHVTCMLGPFGPDVGVVCATYYDIVTF